MGARILDGVVPLVVVDPLPVVRLGLSGSMPDFGYIPVDPADPLKFLRGTPDAVALVTLVVAGDAGAAGRQVLAAASTAVCLIDSWEPRLVREAVRAGAAGIELRSASPDRIASTLDAARRGDAVLPVEMLRAVVDAALPGPSCRVSGSSGQVKVGT